MAPLEQAWPLTTRRHDSLYRLEVCALPPHGMEPNAGALQLSSRVIEARQVGSQPDHRPIVSGRERSSVAEILLEVRF